MQCVPGEVVKNLALLQYGVPSTPTLKQSECVIFQAGKAYTFSGDVFAIVDCDFGFEGAVNYKALQDVLNKYAASEKEVDIEVDSNTNTVLQVKRGRSLTKLPFDPAILLSIAPVSNPDVNGWKELPEAFGKAVIACESVAQITRGDDVLSSINITPTCMEAASTVQIIRHNCDLDISGRFLVRAGILGKLIKAELTEYQVVGEWLFLRSGEVTFAVPVYRDAFIDDIDTFLSPAKTSVEFPEELREEIPFVKAVLTKGEDMKLTLADGKCTIEANGIRGTHTSDVDMITPVEMSFRITPELLGRVLNEFPVCTISEKSGIRVKHDEFSYAASVE